MKTNITEKLFTIALSVLMVLVAGASMTVPAEDEPVIEGKYYAQSGSAVLGCTDLPNDFGFWGADYIAVWGYNGITADDPVVSSDKVISIDVPTRKIRITLNECVAGLEPDKWAKEGTKDISVGFAKPAYMYEDDIKATDMKAEDFLVFYGFRAGDVCRIKLTETQVWDVVVEGVHRTGLSQAIAQDFYNGDKKMTKFWGYDVNINIDGTDYKYSDDETEVTADNTIVINADPADNAKVTIKAVGPYVHPTQKIFVSGRDLKIGKAMTFYRIDNGKVAGAFGDIIVKTAGQQEPATPPATEPAAEPPTESVTEPPTEPTTAPVTEPVTEPATDPVTEPATEPAVPIAGRYYGRSGSTVLGHTDLPDDFDFWGADYIAVWGYNGITAYEPITSASKAIKVNGTAKTITVNLNGNTADLRPDKWAEEGSEDLTIGITAIEYTDGTETARPEDFLTFYGLKVGVADNKIVNRIQLTESQIWNVVINGIPKGSAPVTEPTTAPVTEPATESPTEPVTEPVTEPTAEPTTPSGPAVVPAPAYSGTFDQKMDYTGLIQDMKIPLMGGTNVWITRDDRHEVSLEETGCVAILVPGNDVTALSIYTYDLLDPKISIKVPAGALTKEITFDVTSSDQTFIVPLTDGTYTFLHVRIHSNYDYITPLTQADIIGYGCGADEFNEMVTLRSNSVTGENKTLFFDTIMARAGQMNIFYTGDAYDSDTNGDGVIDKNDLNFKGWVSMDAKREDYSTLVKYLSFKGFNDLNDPAGGTLKPAVPGRLKNVSEFYSTDTLKKEDVYARVSRLSYSLGGEEATMLIYPFGSHRIFEIAYDGNTYVYSMVFNGKHAEMDVTAIGLGIGQQATAKLESRGEYIYDFGGTDVGGYKGFRPDSVPKKSDLVGYGIGALKKTEIPAEISIKNYTTETDYNKTGTVLSFRAPQKTNIEVDPSTFCGCYATVLERAAGKIGYTGDDGLVDYFVKINYSTIGTSRFTMRLTYADGSYRDFVVKSTFETDAKKIRTITLPTSIVPTALFTFPDPGFPIDEEHFPDENFRDFILTGSDSVTNVKIDTDGNGRLSAEEIAAVGSINVKGMDIADLTGIQYFTALKELNCENNRLTNLDVSSNTALTSLICGGNSLTSLDISKNTDLEHLDCGFNRITELNVSGNPLLKFLRCLANKITNLILSANTGLTELICGGNQLESLDVSENALLETLDCVGGGLTSLDISKNAALKRLSCGGNQLESLDVSKNALLEKLSCSENRLTSLDLSANTELKDFECSGNRYRADKYKKFDFSSLSIDKDKTSEWKGCEAREGELDFTDKKAAYTYDCGNGKTAVFTLLAPAVENLGDADGDNKVTADDMKCVYKYLIGSKELGNEIKVEIEIGIKVSTADANEDGIFTADDIQRVYEHNSEINPLPGNAEGME